MIVIDYLERLLCFDAVIDVGLVVRLTVLNHVDASGCPFVRLLRLPVGLIALGLPHGRAHFSIDLAPRGTNICRYPW